MSEYPKAKWIIDEEGEDVVISFDADIAWYRVSGEEAARLLDELKALFKEE